MAAWRSTDNVWFSLKRWIFNQRDYLLQFCSASTPKHPTTIHQNIPQLYTKTSHNMRSSIELPTYSPNPRARSAHIIDMPVLAEIDNHNGEVLVPSQLNPELEPSCDQSHLDSSKPLHHTETTTPSPCSCHTRMWTTSAFDRNSRQVEIVAIKCLCILMLAILILSTIMVLYRWTCNRPIHPEVVIYTMDNVERDTKASRYSTRWRIMRLGDFSLYIEKGGTKRMWAGSADMNWRRSKPWTFSA